MSPSFSIICLVLSSKIAVYGGVLYQVVQMDKTGCVLIVIGADGKMTGTEGFFDLKHIPGDPGRGVQANAKLAYIASIAGVYFPKAGRQFPVFLNSKALFSAAYGRFDGIVINPAAYTHTSVAILDALKAVAIPTVEVHLSNIHEREAFRKISYVAPACERTFADMGFEGYALAIRYLAGKEE